MHKEAEEYDLERIRFLTSHPNWMTDELLETVAELPRVMPQIEVPVQAGHDDVLAKMKRGYRVSDYIKLVEKIRTIYPRGRHSYRYHCGLSGRERVSIPVYL